MDTLQFLDLQQGTPILFLMGLWGGDFLPFLSPLTPSVLLLPCSMEVETSENPGRCSDRFLHCEGADPGAWCSYGCPVPSP